MEARAENGEARMRRHELSDTQWEQIKDFLPQPKTRGRPPADSRKMVNGMLWIVRTGAPWRDLPERFGPWETIYTRFNNWCKAGVWKHVLDRLQSRMEERGQIDWGLFCIDGSVIRASRAAAGARKKTKPVNRWIKPWAGRAAVFPPNCTWWWTGRDCLWW